MKRKHTPQRVYLIKLTLREEEDDDLIAVLESAPFRCRAALVKTAMRTGELPTSAPAPVEDITGDLAGFLI